METINNKANRVSLIKVKIILSNHISHYSFSILCSIPSTKGFSFLLKYKKSKAS